MRTEAYLHGLTSIGTSGTGRRDSSIRSMPGMAPQELVNSAMRGLLGFINSKLSDLVGSSYLLTILTE